MDIVTINLKGKTDIADFMIVASGTSSRHVNSIAQKLLEELRHNDVKGIEPEGTETGDWVLVDAFDVIVHLFKPEIREKYELEKMWQVPGEGRKEKALKKDKKPAPKKADGKKAPGKKPAGRKAPAAKGKPKGKPAAKKTTAKKK